MKNYTIRSDCIFCSTPLKTTFFPYDYSCYSAHYSVSCNTDAHHIPYNIYICDVCKTAQLKYLGDLSEIYKINHADSTGKVMTGLHQLISDYILKYKDQIHGILEIGSSCGILAEKILDRMTHMDYTIIEPCYWGSHDHPRKHIIHDFYENVDDTLIPANTLIISHVFEHFYEPMTILKKINANKNIQHFFLVFPDLEYYINHSILHVLNTEHTYYVDNNFLSEVFRLYGFDQVDAIKYENHSVLFHFQRSVNIPHSLPKTFPINKNYQLQQYHDSIFQKIKTIQHDSTSYKHIYIWPASIHTLTLFIFGLHPSIITGLLDNSSLKIGKKIYGINIPIFSFQDMIQKDEKDTIVFLNGGVFNNEIQNSLLNVKHTKYILI